MSRSRLCPDLRMRILLAACLTLLCFVAVAKAEPSIWVVRDADSTIYLIGTIHILQPEMVWQARRITDAVKESTELWLEMAENDQAAAMALAPKYGFNSEGSLTQRLKPKLRTRLKKLAEGYGFPLAALDKMKPWMAAVTLTVLPLQKAGYNSDAGVETILRKQAESEGDQIAGFESMEEQFNLLDSIPEREQMALLEETIDDVEEGLALLEKMTKAWSDGDIKTLGALFIDEMKRDAPNLYEELIVKRNVRWSEKIAELAGRSGVQVVAVGAAHLLGPDSLQAQLARRGIKVERY